MAISSSKNGNVVTISISGRFDFSSHKEFREAYSTTDGAASEYVVDMSATEYIDSSALGMLLLLREHAGSEQAKISIRGTRTEVKDILIVSNFDKLFVLN
ncbi:MAG: STAS domain-containing protein [Pseudomonadota bacterium]